jgi:predicted nucleic acid-binding protein
MIYHIDKKDVDILALSSKSDCFLCSQDKDFEKCGFKKLLKTYDFIK